jgi:hypothetical protein
MTTAIIQDFHQDPKTAPKSKQEKHFLPLDQETRSTIPTDAAAYHLNRSPQTLRAWACLETGPINPVRINGRLSWSVTTISALIAKGDA